jgi:hypothetical protein
MDLKEVTRIKDLINKNEIEKAKAQGVKESIKKQWKEKFGTDDVEEIKGKLQEMQGELDNSNKRLETLSNKLFNSYDWDKLEEELGA